MTTIAYRDGIMAGDGRETCENHDGASTVVVRDDCIKVYRLKDGRLFGGAHGSEDIERLLSALQKGLAPPKLECIAGLLVDLKRRLWLYEGNIWQRVKMPYYAVGSGSIYAFAAMDAGASAVEACRIGAKRDPFSGGKITKVKL